MSQAEQNERLNQLQKALASEVASKIVQVEIRNVYGNKMLYPANQVAKDFAELLAVKTFNRHQVEGMKKLGYTVVQAVAEIQL